MSNNYTKTMREALQEARDYRDPTNEGGPGSGPQKGGKKFSDKQIKQAYGILNDPRYKQGNYSGASKAIDKLAPGLSNHPDVKNAMKRANETLDLPATGDTTTSNASQEDIVEKNINEVAPLAIAALVARILGTTVAKNAGSAVKKALSSVSTVAKPAAISTSPIIGTGGVSAKSESIENNEVDTTEGFDMGNIRPRDSMGKRLPFDKYPKPKVPIIKVPSIPVPTMNYVGSKTEASFSKGQMDALVKGFGPLGGSERNKIKMDKVADILKKLPKDALMQLSKANLPMVSKVAKQLSEIGNQSYPSGYKSGYKGGIGVSFMDRNRELSRKYASAASKVAKIPMGPKKL